MRAKVRSNQYEKLVEKIHKLMAIDGQAGLVAKLCMLAGLTEDEVEYCFNQEICDNSSCNCHKLHIINKRNGVTAVVVNWSRGSGRRIYFALMPTLLWTAFRELSALNEADIRAASKVAKDSAGIKLSCVCKIFYAIIKAEMDADQIDVLVGRAGPCAAKCMLLCELDDLIDSYVKGWEKVGLVLPVL